MSAESADLSDLHWLVSAEAAEIFAQQSNPQLSVAQLAQLNREIGPARASLVSEQLELRQRGKAKFSRAEQMFFTRVGLEQATDEAIAAYKATRFGAANNVVDLCCGVGGDLLALADGRTAVGVDLSPQLAILAVANCAAYGRTATSQSVDAASVDVGSFDAWHCDPDRRAADRRTTQLDAFSPSADQLEDLLKQNNTAAIKLAPATQVPFPWRQQGELEWISSRRECRQLVAWLGDLASAPVGRRATHIDNEGAASTFASVDDAELQVAADIGEYLLEPNPALLAADLVDAFAAAHRLGRILPRSVYLTGAAAVDSPLVASFQVQDQLPIDRKSLSKRLKEQGIGRVEVKVRGLDIRPEAFLKKLRLSGDTAATIILTPTPSGNRAILCQRVAA